jgi:hypothetical protein
MPKVHTIKVVERPLHEIKAVQVAASYFFFFMAI